MFTLTLRNGSHFALTKKKPECPKTRSKPIERVSTTTKTSVRAKKKKKKIKGGRGELQNYLSISTFASSQAVSQNTA